MSVALFSLFSFSGGTPGPLTAYNDDQAIDDIFDTLGLGYGMYKNEKKVQMLQNPMQFLQQRNTTLNQLAVTIKGDGTNPGLYQQMLNHINQQLGGKYAHFQNSSWVKRLAAKGAAMAALTQKEIIDMKFPVLEKAEAVKRRAEKEKTKIDEKRKDLNVALGTQ